MTGTGRRVVVTGATGLVGRSVTRLLRARGDEVVAVIRPGSASPLPPGAATVEIDLAERPEEALAALGAFDAVIHLAQAPGWHAFPQRAGAAARVNVAGGAVVAEAAVAAGARCMVMASSGGVYGPSPAPITEDAAVRPAGDIGFYLAAKVAAEALLSHFSPHLVVHVLRPFFVYGPGQAPSFLIPRLIRSVRGGAPIRIDGGTGPSMNPIWVDDAAAAFVAALDLPTAATVNIAGPDIVTVRRIAELAAERLGRAARFEETPRPPDNYVADTALMTHKLGAAATPFPKGLSDMIASIQADE